MTTLASFARRAYRKVSPWAFGLFNRDTVTGFRLARRADIVGIGGSTEQWFVPASLLGRRSVCYLVGCGEDISLDLGEIERFGCDVFAFDPTPRAIEHVSKVARDNPKYHFAPIGVWDRRESLKFYAPRNAEHVSHSALNLQKTDQYLAEVDRLKTIMEASGYDWLDLLKLDIEGAEYKVIQSPLADRLDVNVLCVEYDEYSSPLDDGYRERIRASVASLLEAGYELAHSDGNANYTFVRRTDPWQVGLEAEKRPW